jgi:hypothetical protein
LQPACRKRRKFAGKFERFLKRRLVIVCKNSPVGGGEKGLSQGGQCRRTEDAGAMFLCGQVFVGEQLLQNETVYG